MTYNALTRHYFDTTPRSGALPGPSIARGEAGDRRLGVWVRFDARIVDGRVTETAFAAYGCPYTLAIAAWVAEQVIGRGFDQGLPCAVTDITQRFELPTEKLKVLLTIEDAWSATMRVVNATSAAK
jgi:NifU-like protein involved in Fe-S cluster formation